MYTNSSFLFVLLFFGICFVLWWLFCPFFLSLSGTKAEERETARSKPTADSNTTSPHKTHATRPPASTTMKQQQMPTLLVLFIWIDLLYHLGRLLPFFAKYCFFLSLLVVICLCFYSIMNHSMPACFASRYLVLLIVYSI